MELNVFGFNIRIVTTAQRSVQHPAQPTRLTLLHSRGLFRASLARLLAEERDFGLVAECGDASSALGSLAQSPPDVLLFDFGIWHEFVAAARRSGYQGKFLALAEELDAIGCVRALSRGISGVVLSSDSPVQLVQAIRVVAGGGAWVDQTVIQHLAERYPHHEEVHLDGLSGREQAVLRGILSGLTNRKIADQIGASEATVKATLQQLFDKTGVRTRSQLVRIAMADSNLTSGHAEARHV